MKREYDFSKGERGRFYFESVEASLPNLDEKAVWVGPEGPLGTFVIKETKKTLDSYRAQPRRIAEDANHEQFTAHGGYAHRQLFELVQNSADALLDAPNGKSILIRLTERFLYCADDGEPIDRDGVTALMFSRLSPKRRTGHIGRFGLGFKAVLRVSNAPEFYSRPGSFRFDSTCAARQIAEISLAEQYPALRLPEPIDPDEEINKDDELRELTSWATNVVRLPLKPGAYSDLAQQIRDFPPEFLLFVDHVRYLTLEDGQVCRSFMLRDRQGELHLDTGEGTTRWRLFQITHSLSAEARRDWVLPESNDDVTISWAAPLDRLDRPGHFWTFFPTSTASLVAGILNARWKTNEDRQNLLPGPYNDELIKSAATMIAVALPRLATLDDPARHLDALPRRHDGADSDQADHLRKHLYSNLQEREFVPDQDGTPHVSRDLSYPPKELTSNQPIDARPFDRWAAYLGRPRDWLHHKALTPIRLARIDRLFHPEGDPPRWLSAGAPRASLPKWLEALVEGTEAEEAIQASMAAIQTAVLVPREMRAMVNQARVVFTADLNWHSLDPEHLFLADETLGDGDTEDSGPFVHPKLASDHDTLSALKQLGFKLPSPESRFRRVARRVLGGARQEAADGHGEFWASARKLSVEAIIAILREHKDSDGELWPRKLRVRALSGVWKPLHSVLLPGEIVKSDGTRDKDATVDIRFHEPDGQLLHALGVTDAPRDGCDLSVEPWFLGFLECCRKRFTSRSLDRNPHSYLLNFETNVGHGPLDVLCRLSDKGRSRYTESLLSNHATYRTWRIRHDSSSAYPPLLCESPAVMMLRKHGRIRTPHSIVPLAHALGRFPKSPQALHVLLAHPKADRIKTAFELADPTPEFFGEGEPVPLTDVWPGLKEYLPSHRKQCRLVSCERILVVGQPRPCVFHTPDVYLVGTVDDAEQCKLRLIAEELGLPLSPGQIQAIVERRTPSDIDERRAAIHKCSTDPERLLAAVGEQEVRRDLPGSLLAVLESDGTTLTGTDIAEAAIATYHTDALRQYRWALDHLDPPSRWAGSARAVKFVRSLGFSTRWAGERDRNPDPFLEVEGPYSLPPLHDYQRTIVDNIREVLSGRYGTERRGMISMPTGSGKTRVAVQAIVEAMRDDGFRGGVLWVADRDELCEQAVESWRQVWSSIGTEGVQLRISRMWAGQPSPIPTNDLHVIVATIQTLHTRLENQPDEYEFLADFKVVVFDEAHRSIAPTFTSVMGEIGLTRFQRRDEPFMLGLTATPYRGHDAEETARLVRRYGSRRLDSGAFASDETEAVIHDLQDMGVLAHADHETIQGETFPLEAIFDGSLDEDELKEMLDKWSALPWLPQSVEERIARSATRTKRIIEAYETHIEPDWPTLIFATSVEHAQTVAALLNQRGIPSRSVSGKTETATRRRVVEEFRHGRIIALVNYGVFREGFDAPKTRAIIVARPVYSPNLYFQMIGRGLRGRLNGGDERCLVLNVRDNIENFDRTLAFSELDWLWA